MSTFAVLSTAISLTAAIVSGQILAEAPASACPPGVNVTFYDLGEAQALYLEDQFPFIRGPGELLNTLKASESIVVSEINFAPDNASDLDGFRNNPQPWSRKTPDGFFGTVAIFETKINIFQDGFWTLFLASSNPVQFNLSQPGVATPILEAGSQLEVEGDTTYGAVQFVQFNLTKGLYDLVIEWHGGLPGQPAAEPMLVLEFAWTADAAKIPSPSVPKSPRAIVPASMLYTVCPGALSLAPLFSAPMYPAEYGEPVESPEPSGPPQLSLSNAPTFIQLTPAEGPQADSPARGLLAPGFESPLGPDLFSLAAVTPEEATCQVTYDISPVWFDEKAKNLNAAVTFKLVSKSPISVPYEVVLGGAFWRASAKPYNIELSTGPSPSGVFSGAVQETWENLGPEDGPVAIGATFSSDKSDLSPTVVLINGELCSLEKQ